MKKDSFSGMKVLIMGLGLHGGGAESARYLAEKGAEVTVTDLRDEKILAPSIEKLAAYPIRYILGKHNIEDFRNADMVIKNPGVKPDSSFLRAARRVETDISLFLAACPGLILAVTGSKGKSTVSSALYHVLNEYKNYQTAKMSGNSWLGGNIAVSPLSFIDKVKEGDDVVLELSSWQLGDLRGRELLKPRAAVLTSIMRDHLDRYGTMDAYVGDKRLIYQNQDKNDVTVAENDDWGKSFLSESRGRPLVYSAAKLPEGVYGAWIENTGGPGLARLWEIKRKTEISGKKEEPGRVAEVVPGKLLIPGRHQKKNLLAAALTLLDLALEPDFVRESLGRFPGIEHRLEFFHEAGGIRFYNDSAATIPEAAAAAIDAFEKAPVLVTGGTDKDLDFSPLAKAAGRAKEIILIAGTGSEKLKSLLESGGIKYRGPYDSLDKAINAALELAIPGDSVVLSPGCTSFGMFLNEFDRGKQWKDRVRKLTG